MKIIIDGNNVSHIVNHSMGHLSSDEQRTGVIFGFMRQLLALSKLMDSKDFIFCWDSQKSFRKKECPTYKSNRNSREVDDGKLEERQILFDQISEIRTEVLPALGFKNNFIKTGYEADDLIAYIVLIFPKDEYTIVSTDQDLWQLLENHVRAYNTITKKFFTKKDFMEKFQIEPVMFREIKAIAGCNSDFVKGINGVGEVTAAKYLRGEKISPALHERIRKGCDIISNNRKLTFLPYQPGPYEGTIKNLGIKLQKDNLQMKQFKALFNKYSFNSFIKDFRFWERAFFS